MMSPMDELRGLLPETAKFCDQLKADGFQVEASLDRSNPEFVTVSLKVAGTPALLKKMIDAMHKVPALPGVKMCINWGEVQL